MFRTYDRNRKGYIDKSDMIKFCKKLRENITEKQIDFIFEKFSNLDHEGEKVLSYEDFKNAMTSI